MANENPSIISHVSLGTNDFPSARAFYERVLGTLGCRIIMEHEGAAAFGKAWDAWRTAVVKGEEPVSKLNARWSECTQTVYRRGFDSY